MVVELVGASNILLYLYRNDTTIILQYYSTIYYIVQSLGVGDKYQLQHPKLLTTTLLTQKIKI